MSRNASHAHDDRNRYCAFDKCFVSFRREGWLHVVNELGPGDNSANLVHWITSIRMSIFRFFMFGLQDTGSDEGGSADNGCNQVTREHSSLEFEYTQPVPEARLMR